MTYLNWAATSCPKPACVGAAMVDALGTCGSPGRGAHETELDAARVILNARRSLARLVGFEFPERVCLMANATAALNTALMGLVRPGDHVVASDWDHNSVLRPLHRLEVERGAHVDYVPVGRDGRLDADDFARLVTRDTRVVVACHASNLTGDVLDVAKVAEVAHGVGATLVVDAAQTAGCLPIDMMGQNIDVLCLTGHKSLMGPTGTGAIVVSPGVEVDPLMVGGTGVRSYEVDQPAEYPEHLEAGTANVVGAAGLAAAVDYVLDQGLDTIHAHDLILIRRLATELDSIDDVVLYGSAADDPGLAAPHAPVVSFNIVGMDSSSVADALAYEYGIASRAGAHCAPRMHRALGTEDTGAVRLSLGWLTRQDDVDAAISAVAEIAEGDVS